VNFIDYPDHLPRAPLSPEAAAVWERWKEICAAHNVKIVLSKPAPLPLDLDLVLPSLSTVGTGPLTWTVTKNRPAPSDTPLCFQGETMTMTPTLMTAAEMRAYLIEKRRELEAQRAAIAAEQAAKEAERLKVWAPVQLAKMLDTLKQGTGEASTSAGDRVEMQAVVDLACSLGYDAAVEMDDREDEVFYAVVKAPALEVDS